MFTKRSAIRWIKWATQVSAVLSLTVTQSSGDALPQPEMAGKCKSLVIIVGAGVSGIGAASKLMQNGVSEITILEAMDRIGGRVNFNKIGGGDYGGVDLGGHWVHGQKDNIVYELAEPLGLVHHSGDFNNATFFRSDGTEMKMKTPIQHLLRSLLEDTHSVELTGKNHQTFEEFTKEIVSNFIKSNDISSKDGAGMQHHIARTLCLLEACSDLSQVSMKTSSAFSECEGDRLIEWKSGGMGNIIHLLTGTHPKSPWHGLGVENKVKLSSRVASVNWAGNGGDGDHGSGCVSVTTESGDEYTADYVIFTPSLNVLKKNHMNIFHPPLPQDKVEAIQSLGMDVVDKIYLVFKESWWPADLNVFHLLHDKQFPNETLDWGDDIISFTGENHNPHVLAAWLIGEGAKRMEASSDDQVTATCMRIMRKYLGKQYDIPDPVTMLRSRWWNNEDVGGSYSYNSVASESVDKPRHLLARPLSTSHGKPVVMFAGEATNPTRFSTVHGALETGWREAQRILDLINNKTL